MLLLPRMRVAGDTVRGILDRYGSCGEGLSLSLQTVYCTLKSDDATDADALRPTGTKTQRVDITPITGQS